MKSIGHRIDAIVTQSARPGNRRIRSLTVDVFDTVVLRDTWPESLQFAEVSASWLPLVRRLVSPTITARELTSYRHYARTLLHRELTSRRDRERDAEVAIEPWFALILDLVARKYGKSLAAESRAKAVGQLIALELKTELRHVRANTALVKELAEARNRHGLRVYFISDMYLSSTHVEKLLKQLGIDLFDGGTTSSELGRGKWSGRAFRAIAANEVFDEFDLRSNIHLGDDRQSDYRSPVAEGSQAILYHSMHHRKRSVARRVGERRLAAQQRAARAVIRRRFVRVNAHLFDAGRIGSLFAPPLHAVRR